MKWKSVVFSGKTPMIAGLLLVVWIYWQGLGGPFIFDDYSVLSPILDASSQNFQWLLKNFLYSSTGPLHRPVSMFSFIADVYLHGANTWWWKLTNLVIHVLCALLIYAVCRRLFHRMQQAPVSVKRGTALGIALIWALHPLNVTTVLYTVQRMTQLSALFSLLGMYVYLLGRERLLLGGRQGWFYIGAAVLVFLPTAALSKENGLLLPLYLGLIELFCFRLEGNTRQEKVTSNRLLLGIAIIPLSVVAMYLLINFPSMVLDGYAGRDYTFSQRLLTEARVLCLYLLQIVCPLPGWLGFYHDDLAVSTGLFQPVTTVLSIILLASLLTAAIYLRKKLPLFSFGVMFYFIGHLMESSIFALELMYEHRNYLPMIGVIMAASGILVAIIKDRRLLTGLGVVIAGLFAVLTLNNVSAWSDEQKLYPYLYQAHPASERLNVVFVNNYAENGDYKTAMQLLNKLNSYGAVINALVIDCMRTHAVSNTQLESAMGKISPVVDSYAQTGLIRLANMGLDGQCRFSDEKFTSLLTQTLTKNYRSPMDAQKISMYQAHFLHKQGKLTEAVGALERTYEMYQNNPNALFLAVHWLLESGDEKAAEEYYMRALACAERSRRDYSEIVEDVEEKFRDYRSGANGSK